MSWSDLELELMVRLGRSDPWGGAAGPEQILKNSLVTVRQRPTHLQCWHAGGAVQMRLGAAGSAVHGEAIYQTS